MHKNIIDHYIFKVNPKLTLEARLSSKAELKLITE